MNEIYEYPMNDYRSYLIHYGTPGMKWGVRNAEWYPIAAYKAHLARVGGSRKSSGRIRSNEGGIFFKKKKKTPEPTVESLKNPRNIRTIRSPYENEVRDNVRTRQEQIKEDNELMMRFRQVQEKMNKGEELTEADKVAYLRYVDPDANKRYKEATKAENKRLRDKREKEKLEEKQKEIMSKGTLDEILKLAGIADNKEVANAIRNRVDLTKALQDVGAEKKERFDRFIDKADKTIKIAKKVSELAKEGYSAYSESRKLLETLGFIEKKNSGFGFTGKSTEEVSMKILAKALKGNISQDDLANYNKYVNNLSNLQRIAFGQSNNGGNTQQKQKGGNNGGSNSGNNQKNNSGGNNGGNTTNTQSSSSNGNTSMQDIVNYAKAFNTSHEEVVQNQVNGVPNANPNTSNSSNSNNNNNSSNGKKKKKNKNNIKSNSNNSSSNSHKYYV